MSEKCAKREVWWLGVGGMDERIRERIGNRALTPIFEKRTLNFHTPDKSGVKRRLRQGTNLCLSIYSVHDAYVLRHTHD